jgi:prevent-host-death family protein
MVTVRLSQLKAELSRYLARVRGGEEVVVTDRGRPVARLVPITGADLPDPARLAALERAGLARPRGRQALIDERETGR